MLEIRPTCGNCNKSLPFDSQEAMICTFECTFECTFCKDCAEQVLKHICPNCGGNFVERPIRPKHLLKKYPVSNKVVYKLVNI